MAPRTRSSLAAANALADATASGERKSTQQLEQDIAQISLAPSRRGRAKPPKNQLSTRAETGSSAGTQITSTPDGDYNTPNTSNAVTPAQNDKSGSTSLSVAASTATDSVPRRSRRTRLVVELPAEIHFDDDDSDNNRTDSKGTLSSVVTRSGRRHRHTSSYAEDSDEYDDLYGNDHSSSAALARRLQQEEDSKVAANHLPMFANQGATSLVDNTLKEKQLSDYLSSTSRKRTLISLNSQSLAGTSDKLEGGKVALQPRKKQKTAPTKSKATTIRQPSPSDEDSNLALGVHGDVADEYSDYQQSDVVIRGAASLRAAMDQANEALRNNPTNAVYIEHGRIRSMVISSADSRASRTLDNRMRLYRRHPEIETMWDDLRNMANLNLEPLAQPPTISLELKPFQLEGLAWMRAMENTQWKGGILGDEMGLGKTLQAVSLIMSDYPAEDPTLVLVPPVALKQWENEISKYTGNILKAIVFHGSEAKTKNLTVKDLKKVNVILMSYNSLESMYRRQVKGVARKDGTMRSESAIHKIKFHRAILDEAHYIKGKVTMTAKACYALKATYRWCLTGTPLQNRIGEFFSLVRFLEGTPYASYLCKQCSCSSLDWSMDGANRCTHCGHYSLQHVNVFNQELLNPIRKFGDKGLGKEAVDNLRLLLSTVMLHRRKKDYTGAMELPAKEIYVDRQFFSEEETDFAASIMNQTARQFNTYAAQGAVLANYANIFGLIMQMRQVANHPDLILQKTNQGAQGVLVCCICDEPAEEAIRSRCRHEFCRQCASSYLEGQDNPDCPRCHIPLSIDLEQPRIEQDETKIKKTSIINRIKMANWTSSSKIELLVHELHRMRSDNASHKSIIFSQFTTMLQLIEWRLRRAGITNVMLDGSMNPSQRQASIKHFMENPEVECFLVSLKAGGVALNLTEASRVFIVDPWWNPAAEWQSADRCHRIGQTRPCTITRLCIEDSVESRMVLLQEKKAQMIKSTINFDDTALDSLSQADLEFLFQGS